MVVRVPQRTCHIAQDRDGSFFELRVPQALEGALDTVQEQIETNRLVGKAKRILIERHGLNDQEAYRRLQAMALANKPRALGAAMRYMTLRPPEDSPAIVTLPGSPPKAAMLRFTQPSASIWSSSP